MTASDILAWAKTVPCYSLFWVDDALWEKMLLVILRENPWQEFDGCINSMLQVYTVRIGRKSMYKSRCKGQL